MDVARLDRTGPLESSTRVHYPGEFLRQPIYASPGYIVFQRGSEIWGVPFSLSDLAIDGTPFRIAHDARLQMDYDLSV